MKVQLKTEEQLRLEGWNLDQGKGDLYKQGRIPINNGMRQLLGSVCNVKTQYDGGIVGIEGFGFPSEVILVELFSDRHIKDAEKLIRYEIGL